MYTNTTLKTRDIHAQEAKEAANRQRLLAQFEALQKGEQPPASPAPAPVAPNTRPPVDRVEALKALGLYRKSVRSTAVPAGYKPQTVFAPILFPYAPGQYLTKLSRTVSREWRGILCGVSTTSLAGGRLSGAQGRNLIRIVEELRKHCYLKVDTNGAPLKAREQVFLSVEGMAYSFAEECSLSPATFYRALQHPLAHLFLRTQVVQQRERGSEAVRNVGTLFSVALYEPAIPEDLESLYWSESVEGEPIFTVPDSISQIERHKERPQTNQKQKEGCGNCGKLTSRLGSFSRNTAAHDEVMQWIDSAALISRAGQQKNPADSVEADLRCYVNSVMTQNPALWEYAAQIAVHHDEKEHHMVAALGYYKALIHLGVPKVRYWVQRIEKWQRAGQRIETPGKLLTYHLNNEAKKATGYPIRDLGTVAGTLNQ